MQALSDYSIDELKLVYQLLHQNISMRPELMDSQLLEDLQVFLQQQAREDGIDVSLHAQWSSWLNGGVELKGL